jgi:hypothetical protein
MQEWETFTGLIVGDAKQETSKDIPNWIEPDRMQAVLLLKVIDDDLSQSKSCSFVFSER